MIEAGDCGGADMPKACAEHDTAADGVVRFTPNVGLLNWHNAMLVL